MTVPSRCRSRSRGRPSMSASHASKTSSSSRQLNSNSKSLPVVDMSSIKPCLHLGSNGRSKSGAATTFTKTTVGTSSSEEDTKILSLDRGRTNRNCRDRAEHRPPNIIASGAVSRDGRGRSLSRPRVAPSSSSARGHSVSAMRKNSEGRKERNDNGRHRSRSRAAQQPRPSASGNNLRASVALPLNELQIDRRAAASVEQGRRGRSRSRPRELRGSGDARNSAVPPARSKSRGRGEMGNIGGDQRIHNNYQRPPSRPRPHKRSSMNSIEEEIHEYPLKPAAQLGTPPPVKPNGRGRSLSRSRGEGLAAGGARSLSRARNRNNNNSSAESNNEPINYNKKNSHNENIAGVKSMLHHLGEKISHEKKQPKSHSAAMAAAAALQDVTDKPRNYVQLEGQKVGRSRSKSRTPRGGNDLPSKHVKAPPSGDQPLRSSTKQRELKHVDAIHPHRRGPRPPSRSVSPSSRRSRSRSVARRQFSSSNLSPSKSPTRRYRSRSRSLGSRCSGSADSEDDVSTSYRSRYSTCSHRTSQSPSVSNRSRRSAGESPSPPRTTNTRAMLSSEMAICAPRKGEAQVDKNGCCSFHPFIQLHKKKPSGGWRIMSKTCPMCDDEEAAASRQRPNIGQISFSTSQPQPQRRDSRGNRSSLTKQSSSSSLRRSLQHEKNYDYSRALVIRERSLSPASEEFSTSRGSHHRRLVKVPSSPSSEERSLSPGCLESEDEYEEEVCKRTSHQQPLNSTAILRYSQRSRTSSFSSSSVDEENDVKCRAIIIPPSDDNPRAIIIPPTPDESSVESSPDEEISNSSGSSCSQEIIEEDMESRSLDSATSGKNSMAEIHSVDAGSRTSCSNSADSCEDQSRQSKSKHVDPFVENVIEKVRATADSLIGELLPRVIEIPVEISPPCDQSVQSKSTHPSQVSGSDKEKMSKRGEDNKSGGTKLPPERIVSISKKSKSSSFHCASRSGQARPQQRRRSSCEKNCDSSVTARNMKQPEKVVDMTRVESLLQKIKARDDINAKVLPKVNETMDALMQKMKDRDSPQQGSLALQENSVPTKSSVRPPPPKPPHPRHSNASPSLPLSSQVPVVGSGAANVNNQRPPPPPPPRPAATQADATGHAIPHPVFGISNENSMAVLNPMPEPELQNEMLSPTFNFETDIEDKKEGNDDWKKYLTGATNKDSAEGRGKGKKSKLSGRSSSSKLAHLERQMIMSVKQMPFTDTFGDFGFYTGQVNDDGRPNGKGSMKYENGVFYEGTWTDGCQDQKAASQYNRIRGGFTSWQGKGKQSSKSGIVLPWNARKNDLYDTTDKLNVRGMEWTDLNGDSGRYTGEVNKDNLPHGNGIMKYDFGLIAEGEWMNGVLKENPQDRMMGVAAAVNSGMSVVGGGRSVGPGMNAGPSMAASVGPMSVGPMSLGPASVMGGMSYGPMPYGGMNPMMMANQHAMVAQHNAMMNTMGGFGGGSVYGGGSVFGGGNMYGQRPMPMQAPAPTSAPPNKPPISEIKIN